MDDARKTPLTGGIVHCRPEAMRFEDCNIYGTVLRKATVFEGAHHVRSAFFRMSRGDVIRDHEHRRWVQVMVVAGAIEVSQANQRVTARAGEVYFLDPGHPHVETALEDSLLLVTQGEDRTGWPGA